MSHDIPSDPADLRRLVRDLVSFSALPAVWIQYDAPRIVDSVAEVLLNSLGLDFVFIMVESGAHTYQTLCLSRTLDPQREAFRAALTPLLRSGANEAFSIPNPAGAGQMRIATQVMGYGVESGQVLAGSSRADFPTQTDCLLLNVAANQAAILLMHKRSELAARESAERFRALSAASPVGIFATDLQGQCTYMNPSCLALCGWSLEQALTHTWLEMVHGEDLADLLERWLARQGPEFRASFRMLSPELGVRWVEARIVPSTAETGQSPGYLGTLMDITAQTEVEADLDRHVRARTAELQEANAQLRAEIDGRERALKSQLESEERFQLLVESVVDYAIFLLDPGGHVMSWNAGAERLKQYHATEIIGSHFSRFYTPEDRELGKPGRLLATAERDGHVLDEGWRVRKDGSLFWAAVVITALRDQQGELRGFAKVTRDMTERRLAEEHLEQSNVRLRQLSVHLQTAREEERATIARELHDELGQILTVAKIDLSRLAKRLTNPLAPEPLPASKIVEEVNAVIQVVDGSLQSTRRIMQELRPQILDEFGLKAALELQVQQFEEHTHIRCHLDANVEKAALPPEQTIALFRIVQEALTNVARHSGASEVHIHLSLVDKVVRLQIEDNGRGIAPQEIEKAGHFGLLGMKERASLLGGEVKITGIPGRGSTVTIRMPAD